MSDDDQMGTLPDDWERAEAHPWVGKPCGVVRLDQEERIPGTIASVERREGDVGRVNVGVELDGEETLLNTDVDRVEVL